MTTQTFAVTPADRSGDSAPRNKGQSAPQSPDQFARPARRL